MNTLLTPYGRCTGCRRGSEGTHQEGTTEHPLKIPCLRAWPGAKCHGLLEAHKLLKRVWQCAVCASLYTQTVLEDLRK